MRQQSKPVFGVTAPAPRITRHAFWLIARHVALPLLSALLALDLLIWAIAEAVWNICLGVWCWF